MIIPETFINYINYGVIGFLLISIIVGLLTGFLKQCIGLFGTIFAFISAKVFAPMLANSISIVKLEMLPNELGALKEIALNKVNYVAWFAIIFLGLFILIKILTPLVVKIANLPVIKLVDRLLGALISVIIYCIFVILITYVLSLPIFANGNDIINNSLLRPAGEITSKVFTTVSDTMSDVIESVSKGEDVSLDQLLEAAKDSDLTKENISKMVKEFGLTIDDINKVIKESGLTKEQLNKEYNIDIDDILNSLKNE